MHELVVIMTFGVSGVVVFEVTICFLLMDVSKII